RASWFIQSSSAVIWSWRDRFGRATTAGRRRHFRVRFEPFQELAAPFPRRGVAQRRRASREASMISRSLRFDPRRGGKSAKSTGLISPCETKRFAPGSEAIEIIGGAKSSHFEGLFVFNGLTPFSFRANRKGQNRSGGGMRGCLASILKNSSRRA